ncbi:MAG: hypothetical protein M3Z03_08220, partial [Actinomycetota bacterium]|nr:hypothetical protein [Actinomycetota bacterium]
GKPVKAGPPPAKAAAKTTKTAAKATKAPARKSGSPLRANSPLRDAEPPPSPAARVDPAKLGGATDSYGPEAQRALFRAGLAEPASGDDVTAETPRPGTPEDRPARFMGRRRRRQLRAD